MEIEIETLEGEMIVVKWEDVGNCFPSDDVIYFCGKPCKLSSARPKKQLVERKFISDVSRLTEDECGPR